MHVEQNVSDNLLRYLTRENDTMEVWKDIQEVGVHQHFWLQSKLGSSNYFKPTTPYVFTWEENKPFLEFVYNIQAPTWYAVAFRKHVGPKRFYAMKNHDHHVMVQDITSVCRICCKQVQEWQSYNLNNHFREFVLSCWTHKTLWHCKHMNIKNMFVWNMVSTKVLWHDDPLDYPSCRWIKNMWASRCQVVLPNGRIFIIP